jgi:broad specificity phosphatase PhoE
MRHEDHQGNILLPDARERAEKRGAQLKEMGFDIEAAFSSPQWRCVETSMFAFRGYGKMVPLATEPLLGDLALDSLVPKGWLGRLKAEAQLHYGNTDDQSLAKIIQTDKYFSEVMIRRGREGAEAIWKILERLRGKTILVCSHGVARIEATINVLCGVPEEDITDIVKELFHRGEIALVTIDPDNTIFNVETIIK